MVSLRDAVHCDVIITAFDVIITAHFLMSSPLYSLLFDKHRFKMASDLRIRATDDSVKISIDLLHAAVCS